MTRAMINESFNDGRATFNITLNISAQNDYGESLSSNHQIDIPTIAFVFLIIFIILIFLASVIGNIFVFTIFYKRRIQLMTISNRFVMNLSVSSFLMSILVMPFSIITTAGHAWYFGDGWCQLTGMLTTLLFSACILTLLLISCDRYTAIMSPLHYSIRFTTDRSTYMIAAVWTFAVLYALPPVFGWNYIQFQPSKGSCTVNWRDSQPKNMSYTIFLTVMCFLLPFSIMLWIYIILYRATKRVTARARRNSIQPDNNSADLAVDEQRSISRRGSSNSLIFTRRSSLNSNATPTRRRESFPNGRRRSSLVSRSISLLFHKDDWKAAKTGLVVIATFLLCWSPYFVVILIESIEGESSQIPAIIECLAYWIALSASAINPIVYVFRSRTIRKEIKILLRRSNGTDESNIAMRTSRRSVDSDINAQDRARLANLLATRIGLQNGSSVTIQSSVNANNCMTTTSSGREDVNSSRKTLNNNTPRSIVANVSDSLSRVDI